jgi:hypothetical protein
MGRKVIDIGLDPSEELGEQIQNLSDFIPIVAVDDIYSIDLLNTANKKVEIATGDATGKTISLLDVPTRCELYIEFEYANECAITWFDGISWLSGFAPTFYEGKTYRLVFSTKDSGTTWHGMYSGGW